MTGRKIDIEGCQGINFNNVTPDVFSCLKKKLQNYGIEVSPGNSGVLEGIGVVADGGTQVKKTSEVGKIQIDAIEEKTDMTVVKYSLQ